MIRNGLYSLSAKAMDGVDGGDSGVLVLRDGTIRGGTSFFYLIGTYSCSYGRWKGEITSQEHSQAPVPVVNQIRTYWWCSPPRIGRQQMCPASSTAREIGASFSKDKCVLISL